MLVACILHESERRGRIEVVDHHAITSIRHDAEQVAGFTENQIAAGWIEFTKQTSKKASVQSDVFRSGWIDLKPALAIIIIGCPDEYRVLEFVGGS